MSRAGKEFTKSKRKFKKQRKGGTDRLLQATAGHTDKGCPWEWGEHAGLSWGRGCAHRGVGAWVCGRVVGLRTPVRRGRGLRQVGLSFGEVRVASPGL